jgi:preprotein translocase subunit SecE
VKKIIQFCKECVAELKKVIWPSRDDALSSVKVIVVSLVLIALVLGAVDIVFLQGIRLIFA